MGSYTWICLILFYICVTKNAQGHMTLDSAQDDTNSGDSSMNTMLFKFLLETLVSDSSDLNNKLDILEDKYYEQNYKIADLETTLGEQTDEILELKENVASSEKHVVEQNKKISGLETKSDKIDGLETTLGKQNDEILKLKGNLISSEKLVIKQNKKISELETKSDKIDGLETTLGEQNDEILELKGNLISSEKLAIEQNKKISELETKSDKIDELETTLCEVEGNLVSSQKLVIEQSKKILELETNLNAKVQQPTYAFSAYDLSAASGPGTGTILVFAKTHLSENSVYNTATGKFTAPVDGVFVFHATLHVDGIRKYVHVDFNAGGKAIGHFMVGDDYNDDSSSGSAIAQLQKGTEVYLKVTKASSGITFRENAHGMSTFSGHLLSN